MKDSTKVILVIVSSFVLTALIIIGVIAFFVPLKSEVTYVTDFESCVKATGIVMESYPRQCVFQGETFVEEILPENYDSLPEWKKDGVILMRNGETGDYNCFGCNDELCVDPAPVMEPAEETSERHCSIDFEVVYS